MTFAPCRGFYSGYFFNASPLSARLKLMVRIEGEGGELLDCDNAVTMDRAGSVPNSRFIVVIDEY